MSKKGWLIVNGFLQKEKYLTLYAFLENAARQKGVQLEIKCNTDLMALSFDEITLPDFVLFWDKDIPLGRRLEKAGVPIFNSVDAVATCDSKILTALALEGKVNVPKTLFAPKTFAGVGYTDTTFLETVEKALGLPFVIKEECGSFGAQVHLVDNLLLAKEILDKTDGRGVIFQEFISTSRGRDVRINVVGDKVHSAILRENADDFRSNISGGGKGTAYEPTEAQSQAALTACRAIGLDFAGVDILFGQDGEAIVCEVNSNPHFKSTFDCTGKDMSISIIEHILEKLS